MFQFDAGLLLRPPWLLPIGAGAAACRVQRGTGRGSTATATAAAGVTNCYFGMTGTNVEYQHFISETESKHLLHAKARILQFHFTCTYRNAVHNNLKRCVSYLIPRS